MWLGQLGGRHHRSTGWGLGASLSFLPVVARPQGQCLARDNDGSSPVAEKSSFLKTQAAETQAGLGPGADAKDREPQGLAEVYSGCFQPGQRCPHSLHARLKPLPCSELSDRSRIRTSLPSIPLPHCEAWDDAEKGSPEITTVQAPTGAMLQHSPVAGGHKDQEDSCVQDIRSSCYKWLA